MPKYGLHIRPSQHGSIVAWQFSPFFWQRAGSTVNANFQYNLSRIYFLCHLAEQFTNKQIIMYVTYLCQRFGALDHRYLWTRIESAQKLKQLCKFLLAYNLRPSCKTWVDWVALADAL